MEISCWNQCRENHPEIYHFIIYFSHFSFSAILQAFFHVKRKFLSFYNHSKPYCKFLNRNNSFIFNSFVVIHSFVAFACCWSTLLCPDLFVNWFIFKCWIFSNKQDRNIALINAFRSRNRVVSVKAKRWHVRSCLLRIFMIWPIYYLFRHFFLEFC